MVTKHTDHSKWSHASPQPLVEGETPAGRNYDSNRLVIATIHKETQTQSVDVAFTDQISSSAIAGMGPSSQELPSSNAVSSLRDVQNETQLQLPNVLQTSSTFSTQAEEGPASLHIERLSAQLSTTVHIGATFDPSSSLNHETALDPPTSTHQPVLTQVQQFMQLWPSQSSNTRENLLTPHPGSSFPRQYAQAEQQQPSSTVTQICPQADQAADNISVLASGTQPDSISLLQSAEAQHPVDMSTSLNDHRGAIQPSSTILQESLDAQQPTDDESNI
mgnify:CR=1 FL=1